MIYQFYRKSTIGTYNQKIFKMATEAAISDFISFKTSLTLVELNIIHKHKLICTTHLLHCIEIPKGTTMKPIPSNIVNYNTYMYI